MIANDKRGWAHDRLRAALHLEPEETPFPWQHDLLDRFLDGRPPTAVDVPTGLGKTGAMAVWLVARAAGAPVPRRLVYVVDRRAVVDQATEVAEKLRHTVDDDAELKEGLGLEGPLPISTLRGQHIDNRQWLADPSAPAIVLGTVDMVGSRLLFGGYGISARMRPYHAGLLGADSLIMLDEAHLVPPFERLVETLAAGRDARGCSLRAERSLEQIVPPLRLLSLSATGRERDDTLRLSARDGAHPTVAERLTATKRVTLSEEVSARDLPDRLAAAAWALSADGTKPLRCLVFCNSREVAQTVHDRLKESRKKAPVEGIEVDLFVGARRVFEREATARRLGDWGFLAGRGGRPAGATFVVATSAGEVGVDLDADAMVGDLVAWERMVQRLGRVNRRGKGDASVVIVPATTDDAALEARLRAVRSLLAELPRDEHGAFDASPGALVALKERCAADRAIAELVKDASTPPELHPPLARATVEAWSMTSLEEHSGRPNIDPWIRGWVEQDAPQTTVVWREHLPIMDDGQPLDAVDLATFREAAEPHLAERLETETYRVVEWLGKRLKKLQAPQNADAAIATGDRPLRKTDVVAVIFDAPTGARLLRADDLSNKAKREDVERALAGSVLLVDVRLGGLELGLLKAESESASDVTRADPDQVPFRVRRVTLDQEDAPIPEAAPREPAKKKWREEARVAVGHKNDEETAWLVIESRPGDAAESEEGRSTAGRDQKLEEHHDWTEREARRLADRLTLPEPYAQMLAAAARLHDEGKRAACWQRAFRAPSDGVYAKTRSRPNLHLLGRYRHELGSLPYAERDERLRALDEPLRDLALHLIASHHGHARPWLRIDGAEEPPSRLEERSREIAMRFARLERRWGPWGLAWWEALLRAADQQASRKNDSEADHHG